MRSAARAAAVIVAVLLLYRLVWLPWRAQHVLTAVSVRTEAVVREPQLKAQIGRDNLERLQDVAPVLTTDPDFYLAYAANARLADDLPLAIAQYTAALQRADRRPEIYFERGMTYLAMGNIDAATADLARAARFNPGLLDQISGELRVRVARAAGLPE
jgi:tetratricopeptide (TPR) repeat protein